MFIEIPNYLSAETVEYIRNSVNPFVEKQEKYTPTCNREGISVPVTSNPALLDLDAVLHRIFMDIQKTVIAPRYRPAHPSADSGYEYHKYNPGDICMYHSDGEVFANDESNRYKIRYASVILHLTTNEDGGELIFPNQNKKIKTEAGKLVVFPPYGMFGHYTTPSSTPREIMMTWFNYDGLTAMKA